MERRLARCLRVPVDYLIVCAREGGSGSTSNRILARLHQHSRGCVGRARRSERHGRVVAQPHLPRAACQRE
jgi:hypothetical protein